MEVQTGKGEKIERELTGEPIFAEGVTVLPVARLQGRIWRGPEKPPEGVTAHFEAGYAHVKPVRVIVTHASGAEQTIAITDVTGQALRGIGSAALGIAGVCLLVMLVRKLLG